jgi:cob(I)alamin adenosyltransferase
VKVYTRGGDAGDTSLFGGRRVRKHDPRVEAYGSVDELNAVLGMALVEITDADLRGWLTTIQSALFDLGAELSTPDAERKSGAKALPHVSDAEVVELEQWIDRLDEELEPLRAFVLPGGTRGSALLHLARTVCRRAERRTVELAEREAVAPTAIRYLNRLSDFLFTLARAVNRRAGVAEPQWVGRER